MRGSFLVIRLNLLILLALPLLCAAQTRRALLIGIDTYQPAGTTAEHPAGCAYGRCELGTFENLAGCGQRCAVDGRSADQPEVRISCRAGCVVDQSSGAAAATGNESAAGSTD